MVAKRARRYTGSVVQFKDGRKESEEIYRECSTVQGWSQGLQTMNATDLSVHVPHTFAIQTLFSYSKEIRSDP